MFNPSKRILTTSLAFLIFSTAVAKSAGLSDGLVLRFRNGPAAFKIKDSSKQKNDGHAVSVVVSNSPSLVSMQETRQLTLAIWIKPNSIPSEFPVLISKGGNKQPGAYGGYELLLNANGGNDILFVSGGFYSDTAGAGGSLVNNHLGEWIHIAYTIDASAQAAQFFVNGQAVTNFSSSGSISDINFDVPNDLYIGTPDPVADGNRARFDGDIGTVMIYNRALSPEEIQKLFSSTRPRAKALPIR